MMHRLGGAVIPKSLRDQESGAVLILMAFLITILMGMAAFAVDYGWLFLNGIKIQHGADAAALSGVVYEPDDRATAYLEAANAAAENGFTAGDSVVNPVDFVEDPLAVENSNQLRVTISHDVPTFFMRVFGIDTVTVTRSAVAEFVLPLPLGSPEPRFGTDPATGYDPGFWGNIHGYYTQKKQGDRYSSQCVSNNQGAGCPENPERRPTVFPNSQDASGGYVYGVEFDSNPTGVTVEIFDGPFTRDMGDRVLNGDQAPGGSTDFPTTVFILYGPDPTPLNTSDNEVLCTVEYAPRDAYMPGATESTTWAEVDAYLISQGEVGLEFLWDEMCPSSDLDRGSGVYPLRIFTKAEDTAGLNRWSLRASTSNGVVPRVYALGDMAIFSNIDGTVSNAEFYLAEVVELHKGKTLAISLWDPGDAGGDHSIDILDPFGNVAQCDWTATNGDSSGGLGPCNVVTTGSPYNDHLVEIKVSLGDAYSCNAGNCWWKIRYNYGGTTQDTTTWEARIEGNPVKLVE
jgi:Flp pilus assembly protein TadG